MPPRNTQLSVACKTAFARQDPILCLAPGLFRMLNKKEKERALKKLDVEYFFGDGDGETKVQFVGPEPLGDNDLLVLIGLAAIGGLMGETISPADKSEIRYYLRKELALIGDAEGMDVIMIEGSYRELAREIGLKNVDDTKSITNCLKRIYSVSIFITRDKKEQGFRLISSYASDSPAGRLRVALNPQITMAIMGGQHVRLDMREVRALKSGPALLLHCRLAGWVDPGKFRKVTLETLCSYAWPETTNNKNTQKTRRQVIRRALAELQMVGWTVTEYEAGKFDIRRPAPEEGAWSWANDGQ